MATEEQMRNRAQANDPLTQRVMDLEARCSDIENDIRSVLVTGNLKYVNRDELLSFKTNLEAKINSLEKDLEEHEKTPTYEISFVDRWKNKLLRK